MEFCNFLCIQIYKFSLRSVMHFFVTHLQYLSCNMIIPDGLIVSLILWLTALCNCTPHSRIIRDKNINRYKFLNGEPVALANLIQEYEHEHLELFNKEATKDNNLEWNDLENKNLNEFCRRYLHKCVPGRSTCNAIGSKNNMTLRYTNPGYESVRTNVFVVTCTVPQTKKLFYYLTKALEPNCVYALNRPRGGGCSVIFTIIYKHCDFELHDYNEKKRQKRIHVTNEQCKTNNNYEIFRRQHKSGGSHSFHRRTGQFIADDQSIRTYELEHQEMHKDGGIEEFKQWPHVMQHGNLNEYCLKYLNLCTPNRRNENVEGSWNVQKVQWRSSEEKTVEVVVVQCFHHINNRSYYFTKGLDTNCVYALLRDGKHSSNPFLIIFKYCNFDCSNDKQNYLENSKVDNTNIV